MHFGLDFFLFPSIVPSSLRCFFGAGAKTPQIDATAADPDCDIEREGEEDGLGDPCLLSLLMSFSSAAALAEDGNFIIDKPSCVERSVFTCQLRMVL